MNAETGATQKEIDENLSKMAALRLAVQSRISNFVAIIIPCISGFSHYRQTRIVSNFIVGMLNLSLNANYGGASMSDADMAAINIRKKLVLDSIEGLELLARQRGLPYNGFPRSELDQLSLIDLREIHDALHELVYAPPAKR